MASTDGSVNIAVDMNVDDAEKELASLKKQVFSLGKDIGLKKFLKDSLVKQSEEAAFHLDVAKQKLDDMQKASVGTYSGSAIKEQEDHVKLLQKEYDKAAGEAEKITTQIEQTNLELEYTKQRYGDVAAKAERLRQAENNRYVSTETAKKANVNAILPKEGKVDVTELGIIDRAKVKFVQFTDSIKAGLGNAAKKGLSALGSGLKKIPGLMKSAFSKGLQFVKSFGKGLLGVVKNLNVFSKISGKMGPSLSRLGTMVKQAFVFGVVTKGLNYVREQMGELIGKNTEFMAALNRLKGVLLTAFQPIYDYIIPALTTLINGLTRAIAVVAQFISALFGKTASQAQANAKALNKESKAIGGAGKAAEKASKSLANFDEINILSIDNADADGGGGGGGDTGAADFEYMFDDTQMPFSSWGEAFDAFLGKLLDGIPQLRAAFDAFANGLNDFSAKLLQMFTFPGVEEKVIALGVQLAEALNGLVANINWNQLGQALGAGLNLALLFLVNFVYTFDWLALGSSLADGLNGLVSKIDWKAFGQLLWSKFKIALETLAGFILGLDMPQLAKAAGDIVIGFFDSMTETLASIDWFALGEQLKDFLVNVDWANVADSVFTAIGAAFGAAAEFLWGLIKDAWKSVVQWWYDNAYEDGKFMFAGLLEGIWEKAKSIGAWIKEHIFQPFIDGFKKVFGINSPSTVMAEQGGYIIDGLKDGLKNIWEKIKSKFTDTLHNIKEMLSAENLKQIGKNMLDGLFNGLKNIGSKISEWGSSFIGGVKDFFGIHSPSTEFESLGNYMMYGLEGGVTDKTGLVTNAFKVMYDKLLSLNSEHIDTLKTRFSNFLAYLSSSFTSDWQKTWNECEQALIRFVNKAITAVDSLNSKLASIERNIVITITTVTREITESASSGTSSKKSASSKAVKAISALNNLNLPPIPLLAQGAVIPPNREFMAVLGDQPRGNNIEAPEDLIRRIVREESGSNYSNDILREILNTIREGKVMMLDRDVFAKLVYRANQNESQRVGISLAR